MVDSKYTVSSAAQLLGRMPVARVSGRSPKSKTTNSTASSSETEHLRGARGPAPTKPLPPTPIDIARLRTSRSSGVIPATDNVEIKTDLSIPAVVAEDEVLTFPETLYTPTTTFLKITTLASSLIHIPVLETLRKGREASFADETRISQYYEYITPPLSLISTPPGGSNGSRRERKACHTPTNSASSANIHFSPINASRTWGDEVFLSSPQPSPPISLGDGKVNVDNIIEMVGAVVVGENTPWLKPSNVFGSPQQSEKVEKRKITLTLADVDRITTALARAPLVQRKVCGKNWEALLRETTSTGPSHTTIDNNNNTGLPTPPPSSPSQSSTNASTSSPSLSPPASTVTLLNPLLPGNPVLFSSSPSTYPPGKRLPFPLPSLKTTSTTLRILAPSNPEKESKILLSIFHPILDRKTLSPDPSTLLLSEIDVTTSFARAALMELANSLDLTLNDVEIIAPKKDGLVEEEGEEMDWCNLDLPSLETQPPTDHLSGNLRLFARSESEEAGFAEESCTMAPLTLFSHLSHLLSSQSQFLILQPLLFGSANGTELSGVKIPLISPALKLRFAAMGRDAHGGKAGKLFREAVVRAVSGSGGLGEEEEWETCAVVGVDGEGRRRRRDSVVEVRVVPVKGKGAGVERWVCFLG
jgi:hypothetical protein